MTQAIEQKIRERAYEIWMATGCENGLADLHWLSAEQAVMDESTQPGAKATAKVAKKVASRSGSALPKTITVRRSARKRAST